MTKKNHKIYAAISLCGIICYCAFLIKTAISNVNTTEDNVPENETLATEIYEEESVVAVSVPAPSVPELSEETTSEALSSETPKDGFSPIYPIKGEILTPFSLRHTYSSKTGDWRAHGGIDIKGKIGDAVCAIEDGAVIGVYNTPVWGNVVEIDHGEYVSIYKNLDNTAVKVGDNVLRGDVISHIGSSSQIESDTEPHLHFEITYYGESCDPCELLG